MVRAFVPQGRNQSLTTNTNFPPQGMDVSGGDIRPGDFEAYNDGTESGLILYNDGVESGNVIVLEPNPNAWDLPLYENKGIETPLTETAAPRQAIFFPDETGCLVLDNSGNKIVEYEFLVAGDITTKNFVREIILTTFDPGLSNPRGITVTNNGTKAIMSNTNTLFQFSLPNGTATNYSILGMTFDDISLTVFATSIRGIFVKPDDFTTLYTIDSGQIEVSQFDMPNAGLVTGMSVAPDEIHDISGFDSSPQGLYFKTDDGSEMYIYGNNNDKIFQVDLPNAWSLSGAIDTAITSIDLSFVGNVGGINFTDNGNKLRLIKRTNPDKILELSV